MKNTASNGILTRLDAFLHEAINIEGALKGNIQVYNRSEETLNIIAHYGFDRRFLEHFKTVKAFDTSACGRAIGIGSPVVISDVELDAGFVRHIEIARAAGFRAVKSVPLMSDNNNFVGVISTHFKYPQWAWEINKLNSLANELANYIEKEIIRKQMVQIGIEISK